MASVRVLSLTSLRLTVTPPSGPEKLTMPPPIAPPVLWLTWLSVTVTWPSKLAAIPPPGPLPVLSVMRLWPLTLTSPMTTTMAPLPMPPETLSVMRLWPETVTLPTMSKMPPLPNAVSLPTFPVTVLPPMMLTSPTP